MDQGLGPDQYDPCKNLYHDSDLSFDDKNNEAGTYLVLGLTAFNCHCQTFDHLYLCQFCGNPER